jgi:hypothetical protein
MGNENLFMFEERHPHLHMQQALIRAKELIASSNEVLEAAPETPQIGEGGLAEVPIV